MVASKDAKGRVLVCGFVNAKNSLGGYAGMSPFIGNLIEALNGFILYKSALQRVRAPRFKRPAETRACRSGACEGVSSTELA
jgi:hypothetical protein